MEHHLLGRFLDQDSEVLACDINANMSHKVAIINFHHHSTIIYVMNTYRNVTKKL